MKIKSTHICENAAQCPVYDNYIEETKDNRLNIIQYSPVFGFSCIALEALDDPNTEGGINFNKETRVKLKDIKVEKNTGIGEIECGKITLLNLLN